LCPTIFDVIPKAREAGCTEPSLENCPPFEPFEHSDDALPILRTTRKVERSEETQGIFAMEAYKLFKGHFPDPRVV